MFIGTDNGSSLGRHEDITWTKTEILKIKNKIQWSLGQNNDFYWRKAIVFLQYIWAC